MEASEKRLAEAYLLGAYLGDGHCNWDVSDPRHNVYQFVVPSIDEDLLDKIRSSIHTCFPELVDRVVIERRENHNYEQLRCSSKALCQFLRSRCSVKHRLPSFPDLTLFKEFVAGLMDTDGWITEYRISKTPVNPRKPPTRWQMGFATTAPWYGRLRFLLQRSGMKVGSTQEVWKPKDVSWATCYRMYINIRSFVEAGFYFSIARKQERLQNWQRQVGVELSTTTRRAPTHA